MATYYGTYGQKVQYLSSDPPAPQTGQVWYNSTSATLKVRSVTTSGTWASGGNLNTARSGMGAAGTQTATIGFAGYIGPNSAATESYNGTSWTTLPASMNNARYILGGFGTQTAAIGCGGYFFPGGAQSATESWNGSSWTTVNSLPTGRYQGGAAGTQTAGLYSGGAPPANTPTNVSTEWDGTNWTSGGNLNTSRQQTRGAGTQTASLLVGGQTPGSTFLGSTESYNGTSWTTLPASLNTVRGAHGISGDQTNAIVFGGGNAGGPTAFLTATEIWNGSTWTTNPTGLAQKRTDLPTGPVGTATAGFAVGGYNPPSSPINIATTEEWTGPGVGTTKTVTVS